MLQTPEGFAPDFRSRYFKEDFPYGMRYIVDLAYKHIIDIPVVKTIYDWGIKTVFLT